VKKEERKAQDQDEIAHGGGGEINTTSESARGSGSEVRSKMEEKKPKSEKKKEYTGSRSSWGDE